MTFKEIGKLLQIARVSKLNALVYGQEGIGKTSFCKDLFSDAIVILPNELSEMNLSYLRSAFETGKPIIFENLNPESLQFITPILNNRTILGKKLENFFIVTSRAQIEVPNALPIFFHHPSSVSWLEWAKENGIHKSIIKAIENKDLLETHKPRDLHSLSKALNSNVPNELLEKVLEAFLKEDKESIDIIKNDLFNTTSNSSPLEDLSEDFGKQEINYSTHKEKDRVKLEHLAKILDNPEKQRELELELEKKEIKEIVDSFLRDVI